MGIQSVLEDKEKVVSKTSSDWLQSDMETIDWLASSFSFKERGFVPSWLRFMSCSGWFGSEMSKPVGEKSMCSLAIGFPYASLLHLSFTVC